jgi:hypothetical protein
LKHGSEIAPRIRQSPPKDGSATVFKAEARRARSKRVLD